MKTQEQKDFEAKKRKLIREERKLQGLCPNCGKEINKYDVYCDRCFEVRKRSKESSKSKLREAERKKELYDYRKANGICVDCGSRKAWNGTVTCIECTLKRRKRDEKSARAKGVMPISLRNSDKYCSNCLKPVEVKGAKVCNRCQTLNMKKLEKGRDMRLSRILSQEELNEFL